MANSRRKLFTDTTHPFATQTAAAKAANAILAARLAAKVLDAARNKQKQPQRDPRRAGAPSRPLSAPAQRGGPPIAFQASAGANAFSQTNKTQRSTRFQGCSTMLLVQSPLGSDPNIVIPFSTHPLSFGDRFATQASTYDKYVYHSIRAVYTPTCPTTTAGAVAMYFDRDPNDPPANASNVKSIMSMENASLGSVWSRAETHVVRDSQEKRTYFTNPSGGDLREAEQFKLYVYLQGISTAALGYGYVTLHYDVELISPVLAPAEAQNGGALEYQTSTGSCSFGAQANLTSNTASPFGIPTSLSTTTGTILEVILSSRNGASVTNGFVLGSSGPALEQFVNGQPLYLRQGDPAFNASVNAANTWSIYLTEEDAREFTARCVVNSAAGVQTLFTGGVTVRWRVISGTPVRSIYVT